VPIEVVLSVFQVIAAGNFATYFIMIAGRNPLAYLRDNEMMSMLALLLTSVLGIAVYLWLQGTYADLPTAVRYASFNLITIATDCGYASTDFGQWPLFAPLWMLFLSSVLACSGSTGGGIKMIRTMILARQSGREMARLLHPNALLPLKVGSQVIENNVVFSVLGFVFLYFMTIVMLTFALLISGLDFLSSFTAIIACINNTGPGLVPGRTRLDHLRRAERFPDLGVHVTAMLARTSGIIYAAGRTNPGLLEEMSALDTFEKMLAAGKDSAMLRYSLGNEYLKAGRPADAAVHLEAATAPRSRLFRRLEAARQGQGRGGRCASGARCLQPRHRRGRGQGRHPGRQGDEGFRQAAGETVVRRRVTRAGPWANISNH
jgi:hypothetical protein